MKSFSRFIASMATLFLASTAFSQEYYKVDSGWGYSAAASTAQATVLVERNEGAEIVLNGDFSTTNSWTATNYTLDTTNATFSTADTNATLSQTVSSLAAGTYRLVYTATVTGTITNTVVLGTTTATVTTATGTYTEDLIVTAGTALTFASVSTGAATNVIDSVSLKKAPQKGYITEAYLSVGATDVPVYAVYNVDANSFSNIYAAGHAMIITSNSAANPVVIKNQQGIRKISYRSATGTPTILINGF